MAVAISVLVPVYNVEKTLDRCIQSILAQTFQDFEIILVNDGSTDGSGALCDAYAQKHENIRVFHKKNEGLGPTRNLAIREACGKYIYHCDSDDWLKEDLLEKAYCAMERTDADVAVFGYDMFTERKGDLSFYGSATCDSGIIVGKEAVKQFFVENYFNAFIVLSACNRMCRRSFILDNQLFFPALRRCQDMEYALLLFEHIEKLVTISESYYCYIIAPGVYKGRAYAEMLDIYCHIFETTSKCFQSWDLYAPSLQQKLINNCCEQIANYSAYAFAVKYRNAWKANTSILLKDRRVNRLLSQYQNKGSKFMGLFCLAYRLRSQIALLGVSCLAEHVKNKGSNHEKTSNC